MAYNTEVRVYGFGVPVGATIDTRCDLGSYQTGCKFTVPQDTGAGIVETWMGKQKVLYYFVVSAVTNYWYPVARLASDEAGNKIGDALLFYRGIEKFHRDHHTGFRFASPLRLQIGSNLLLTASGDVDLPVIPFLDNSSNCLDSVTGLSLSAISEELNEFFVYCVAGSNSNLANDIWSRLDLGLSKIVESSAFSREVLKYFTTKCENLTDKVNCINDFLEHEDIKADTTSTAMELSIPEGILITRTMDPRFRYLLDKQRLTQNEINEFIKLIHSAASKTSLSPGYPWKIRRKNGIGFCGGLTDDISRDLSDYLVNDDYSGDFIKTFAERYEKCTLITDNSSGLLLDVNGRDDVVIDKTLFMCAAPSLLFGEE